VNSTPGNLPLRWLRSSFERTWTAVLAALAGALLLATAVTSADEPLLVATRTIPLGPPSPDKPARATSGTADLRRESHVLGSASCTASNCHGDPLANDPIRGAYRIWFERDPHARASETLSKPESERMVRALGIKQPATEAAECIGCHSPMAAASDAGSHWHSMSEGVSCEACHGAARDWIEPHRSLDWNNPSIWSDNRKAAAGFQDTKSLHGRASACVKCHVGGGGLDVNHDLIAAGHPRLVYEFAAYNALMPAHWKRSDDRLRHRVDTGGSLASDFEARAWLVGQYVSARQSMDLLIDRCQSSTGTWPELAEFDCYSCHHGLGDRNGARTAGSSGRRPGEMSYGSWTLSNHFRMIDPAKSADGASRFDDLILIQSAMQRIVPDRVDVMQSALDLRQRFDRAAARAATHPLSDAEIRLLCNSLLSPEPHREINNWDEATQLYLAVVALKQGYEDASNATGARSTDLDLQLLDVKRMLDFRTTSPTAVDRPPIAMPDSPGYFSSSDQLDQIRELFRMLHLGSGPSLR
jgi:hypothetical protein